MSEDRPMRHEEYQAMAEELRQKTAENEKLRSRLDKKRPIDWKPVGTALVWAALIATAVLVLFFVCSICASVYKKYQATQDVKLEHEQKYPCFFVRHNLLRKDQEDGLYMKWHVYKNTGDSNYRISLDTEKEEQPTFDTKIEAWNWARSSQMEMCR